MRNGLSAHIDRIHNMMTRANREDGFWGEAIAESFSLENLYEEVEHEMDAIVPHDCLRCKQCKCKKDHDIRI